MEPYYKLIHDTFNVIALSCAGVLVGFFYRPYLRCPRSVVTIGAAFSAIMLFLYFIPVEMTGITAYLIGAVVILLVSVLTDKNELPQKIFLALTIYLLDWNAAWGEHISDLIFDRIAVLAGVSNLGGGRGLIVFGVKSGLGVVMRMAFFTLEIVLVNRADRDKSGGMSPGELILLSSPYLAVMAGYWQSAYLMDVFSDKTGRYVQNDYPVTDLYLTLFRIASFATILAIIHSYQRIRQSHEDRLDRMVLEKDIEELKKHVSDAERFHADIRGLRHDMNNHIQILTGLLGQKEYDDAADYLSQWSGQFQTVTLGVSTGNPVTDMILSEKQKEAEGAGITLASDFHYPEHGGASAVDISIILSNALSNAIRAARSSEGLRSVRVSSWMNRNTFFIETENNYSGKMSFDNETGLAVSDQKSETGHGYGLRNIRRVAEKYNGTMELIQDGDTVILTVMLLLAV